MERIVCLDTSVLLEYFRKKNKENTFLVKLLDQHDRFEITSITQFEINYGINPAQAGFWNSFLKEIKVLPFDGEAANIAVQYHLTLKSINRQIALPDLFIGATAKRFKRPLATINKKHFERLDDFELITPDSV